MTPTQPTCEEAQKLLPAYSIGATDPEETALVEAMLPVCPELVAELAEYLELAEAMLYLPPTRQSKVTPLTPDAATLPVSNPKNRIQMPTGSSKLRADEPELAHTPRRGARVWLPRVAMILLLLGLGASNLYWANRIQTGEQQAAAALEDLEAARTRITALETTLQNVETQLINAQSAAHANGALLRVTQSLLAEAETNQTLAQARVAELSEALAQASARPGSETDTLLVGNQLSHSYIEHDTDIGRLTAVFAWDQTSDVGAFYITGLQSLPVDETYRLWLIADDHKTAVGDFAISPEGVGLVLFRSEQDVETFSAFAVTSEKVEPDDNAPAREVLVGDI